MRPVRVAVAGSVDDGKSTLLGRLVAEAGRVFDDESAALARASRGDPDWAWLTDGLQVERAEGLTLDVAWRHLFLGAQRLLLADVPGHLELVQNMATGASTADAAVVLVDATRGVQPQTRRHLVWLSALGVTRVLVCVNKLDLVSAARARFVELTAAVHAFSAPLGLALDAVPVSALHGENLVRCGPRLGWWDGGTVATWLAALEPEPAGPLRAVVQLPSDGAGWAALQVSGGRVEPGQVLRRAPMGGEVRVVEVSPHCATRARTSAPLARGEVLAPLEAPVAVRAQVEVLTTWLGAEPLGAGARLELLQRCRSSSVVVERLAARRSLESARWEPAETLARGDVGQLLVRAHAPLVGDEGEPCLFVDARGVTVGGGRFV